MNLVVKESTIEDAGLGVFVAATYLKGDPILSDIGIMIPMAAYSNTVLEEYVYEAEGYDYDAIICLGMGSLLNSSNKPNVEYTITDHKDGYHYCLKYKAARNIQVGEELFIDYEYGEE